VGASWVVELRLGVFICMILGILRAVLPETSSNETRLGVVPLEEWFLRIGRGLRISGSTGLEGDPLPKLLCRSEFAWKDDGISMSKIGLVITIWQDSLTIGPKLNSIGCSCFWVISVDSLFSSTTWSRVFSSVKISGLGF
jgi:hypothetical protein